MKTSILLTTLLTLGAGAACKGKADKKRSPGQASDGGAAPLTDEDRLLSLAGCKMARKGIEQSCAAWKAFRRTESTRDMIRLRGRAEIGLRHLRNPAAAVRARAFIWATRAEGVAPKDRATVIDTVRSEKNVAAQSIMITHVSRALHGDDMARLWLSLADHPSSQIRQRVIMALTHRRMAGTTGTLEKALSMIESDRAIVVRRAGCSRLGDRHDARALPLLSAMTAGPKVMPELYESCFFGLIGMWLSTSTSSASPNQAAYNTTLALLRAKPRSTSAPPRAVVRRLRHAARPAFMKAAPSWYKASELIAALLDVATDSNARPITRGAAIASMQALGATRAQIESVRATISDKPDDRMVKDALTETLERMAKPKPKPKPKP